MLFKTSTSDFCRFIEGYLIGTSYPSMCIVCCDLVKKQLNTFIPKQITKSLKYE